MERQRLALLQLWLLRLWVVTMLLLIAVVAWSISQGHLTRTELSTRLLRLFAAPETVKPSVALISGHRGFDTGAICEDGLMEVVVNEAVTNQAASLLRAAGISVQILDEYDSTLEGLEVDVLVSVHADSCVPLSGFKVAVPEKTVIPQKEEILKTCLEEEYGKETGLNIHPNTETSDMYDYHAFHRIAPLTPAAIIEVGFLGGDRTLLVEQPNIVGRGVAAGIICFLNKELVASP